MNWIKTCLYSFCMVSASALTAQNLITSQYALGCGNSNFPNAPYIDNQGNYYIVSGADLGGGAPNLGNLIAGSKGRAFMLITKYNQTHNLQWQQSYGGDSLEYGTYLALNDGFLFLCSSNSPVSGNKLIPSNGKTHLWLFKTDFDGNITMQKGYFTDNDISAIDLKPLNDGNFLISALAEYGVSGDKTSIGYGDYDGWLIKINSDGDIIWDVAIGTNDLDWGFHIADQFSNEDILIWTASYNNASGAKSENNYGDQNAWFVRISNDGGEIVWEKTIGGGNEGESYGDVKIIDDKISYLTPSYSDVSGNRTLERKGLQDIWFVVLNENCDIEYQHNIGGSAIEARSNILRINGNQIQLSVWSNSGVSIDKTEPSRGLYDIWYLELDMFGGILKQKTLGGFDNDILRHIGVLNNGNYLFVANSRSPISGDKTVPRISFASNDIWILEIDALTLNIVNEHQINKQTALYPNPATNQINIAFSEPTQLNKAVLFDVSGKIVLEQTFENNFESVYAINVSGLASGVYTLRLEGASVVITRQVVVE
jgi:hypothetical protein